MTWMGTTHPSCLYLLHILVCKDVDVARHICINLYRPLAMTWLGVGPRPLPFFVAAG